MDNKNQNLIPFSNKLLGQEDVKECLKLFIKKFYGGYGDLINPLFYEVSLCRMLHNILEHDDMQ